MDYLIRIISGISWPTAFTIVSLAFRKPLMRLKKVSIKNLEIEIKEDADN